MTASDPSPETHPDHGRLHTTIWVLIYGGLLAVCLSLFLPREAELLSLGFLSGGGLAVAVGAVLLVIRSRMPGP
nr:hypothetical protein [uncultured Roseateles sp.]